MPGSLKQTLLTIALVLAIRLPFLNQAIQGDDVYYLYGAEHAQIEPLHPTHTSYVFLGERADMRGHPHPPLNVWTLGILLAIVGDIKEVPFHLAYIAFSIIAALAMLSLARRFVPERAMLAVLLFVAVPPFVINGGSLESDLPFLAFWMAAVALFVRAVDERSTNLLAVSVVCGALAGLAAYQAIALTPILAVYVYEKRRDWKAAWIATLAAPAIIVLYQIFERSTGGAVPAGMLAGYLQQHAFEAWTNKWRSAVALAIHLCCIVSPIGFIAALLRIRRIAVREFLSAWILIFFAMALVIFFAGSARYLLPIAAPLALLITRTVSVPVLWTSIALQMPLALALAAANNQHWDAYRDFAKDLPAAAPARHVWVAGEWGLRFYSEAKGALPLTRDQFLEPGDVVVWSELSGKGSVTAPLAEIAEQDVRPAVPLRLISLDGRSAYSSSAGGFEPFEISTAVADRIHSARVVERSAELTYIDPKDPKAAAQFLIGFSPDGWISGKASVILKNSPGLPLRMELYIPPQAPGRHVQLLADGQLVAEDTFAGPGAYALAAPFQSSAAAVTVTLTVDKTFHVPPDQRQLGVVITGIGFK